MLHGVGAGAFATALGIGINLVLLPLYLRRWSVAVYGEWMALYSIVNYLGTLDFGITTAAINAATMACARKDWGTFKRLQGTAWVASLVMAGVGTLVMGVVLLYFRVDRWLGLKAMSPRESHLVFASLSLSLLVSIPGRQLGSIYVAIGEFAKYQWLYNLGQILAFAASACALLGGARPVQLAVINLLSSVAIIAITYVLIWNRDVRLIPRVRDARMKTTWSLAAPSAQFLMQMIASALLVQGPVVVVSRFLGGPAVAVFTTTRTVTNVVRGILTVFRAPLRPEWAAAYAELTKHKLQSLFRTVMALDTVIGVTLMAALWSGGSWLIRTWSHGRIAPDTFLLHLLLVYSLAEGFIWMLTSAGSTANRFHGFTFGLFLYALVALVLTVVMVRSFGLISVPMGGMIAMIVFFLPLSLLNAHREICLSTRWYVFRLIAPFAAASALVPLISHGIEFAGFAPAWLAAAIGSLLTALCTALLVLPTMLTAADRGALQSRMIRILPAWGR